MTNLETTREKIDAVREMIRDRRHSYDEIAARTAVNPSWLRRFGSKRGGVSGISAKGLGYIDRLYAFFKHQ